MNDLQMLGEDPILGIPRTFRPDPRKLLFSSDSYMNDATKGRVVNPRPKGIFQVIPMGEHTPWGPKDLPRHPLDGRQNNSSYENHRENSFDFGEPALSHSCRDGHASSLGPQPSVFDRIELLVLLYSSPTLIMTASLVR